ncbi:MAG: HAD family hydrolase [Thermodesulfobacteriota bacterium]|nr:HAD family hydrolase [Thermodesulfobacteriota bacterium]
MYNKSQGNIAVFMDRDGTIIDELGYLKDPNDLNIIPGAVDAIRLINRAQMKAVIVTNQSGVARGYLSEEILGNIHQRLLERLMKKDAYIDAIYYCPHHPNEGDLRYRKTCNCRKPYPGMLDMAAKDLKVDLERSYVIGDKIIDMRLAHRVGAKGVLVLTGYGKNEVKLIDDALKSRPHCIAEDILKAVDWILSDLGKRE